MAYITTEQVAEIRKALKTALPAFKFSVTKERHSGVAIKFIAGPAIFQDGDMAGRQLNEYYPDNYGPAAAEVLRTLLQIANKGVTHRETADYGSQPSHYVWLSVGDYSKPYVITENKAA